jgi:5-methylcytosine-specific restriction endonuclease McrA
MTRIPKAERIKRRTFSAAVRQMYSGVPCAVCGSDYQLCIDHRIPLAAGGTNELGNLQSLCGPCNARKGFKRTHEEMTAWYADNKELIDRDRRRRERNRWTNPYDWK